MHTLNLDLYNRTSVSFVAVRCYTGHRATGLLFISNGVTRRERASTLSTLDVSTEGCASRPVL